MDTKKVMLLVGALLVAGITAFMARGLFTSTAAPQAEAAPKVVGVEVLVPVRTLPVGTIIELGLLRYQPWPVDMVEANFYKRGTTTPEQLVGTVVRYDAPAGQPITPATLVRPGDRGFLAAALGPGMRAVTVAVSATSGVAGFVFPGDRVDLVLTQDVPANDGGTPLKASETIVQNIRVLATDQKMTQATDEAGAAKASVSQTVTLEATPKIAEKIVVAQTIGSLSLSLRSLADNVSDLERAIADGEIEAPKSDDPAAEKKMLAAVAARPTDRGATLTTGGEVSRFQRNTAPSINAQMEVARISTAAAVRDARRSYLATGITVRRAGQTETSSAGGQ